MGKAVTAHTKCRAAHTGCSQLCSLLHVYASSAGKSAICSCLKQTRASLRIFHQKVTVRLPEPLALLQLFSALL